MTQESAPYWALELDGQGGCRPVSPDALAASDGRPVWSLWDRLHAETARWLREESGLDAWVCDALVAEDTRPRVAQHGDGMLVILRGVNLNPGADPDDMVSLRMWLEPSRAVWLRGPVVKAVEDVREELEHGLGPGTIADLFVRTATGLVHRMGAVIESMQDAADDLEDRVAAGAGGEMRARLNELRRQAIGLRRYIAPQRDVLAQLSREPVTWLDDRQRLLLREAADRMTRFVEDLDATRERAAICHEELSGRMADQMNRTMYVLSIVAAIFLPLGLVTGLLGMNVGGIPGTAYPWAFALVCTLLGGFGLLAVWVLHRLRFF